MTDHTFLQILENDLGLTDIPATHEWLKENKKSIELKLEEHGAILFKDCLLYTSPSPRDATLSRMPSSA